MVKTSKNWELSRAQHTDWVRQTYPECGLSDNYIDGLVDEASFGLSLAAKLVQTLAVVVLFGWLGKVLTGYFGSQYGTVLRVVCGSVGMFLIFFLLTKPCPLHDMLIRWSISRRLRSQSMH